jgi:uncharacterized repeat protein (TIGR01451 family)
MTNQVTLNPSGTVAEIDGKNDLNDANTIATKSAYHGSNPYIDLSVAEKQVYPDKGGSQQSADCAGLTPALTSPCEVAQNGTLTYELTIANDDPTAYPAGQLSLAEEQIASNVRTRTLLPQGARSISVTANGGGFQCGNPFQNGPQYEVDCTGGTLQPQASATVDVTMFAPPTPTPNASPGAYTTQAFVDPDQGVAEGDETNNTTQVTEHVVSCPDSTTCSSKLGSFNDLVVNQTEPAGWVGAPASALNGTTTYLVNVGNDGTDPATNVDLQDTLPAGARFISATDTSGHGFQCSPVAGSAPVVITCIGGHIGAAPNGLLGGSDSATITVVAYAPGIPGTYKNVATVDSAGSMPEGSNTNNEFDIATPVQDEAGSSSNNAYIDLSLEAAAKLDSPTGTAAGTGTASPPGVVPGGTLVYVLNAHNLGSGDATNVEVKDTLPSGSTQFLSAQDSAPATPGAFSCTQPSSGTIDCTGGSVSAGGTRTIWIFINAPNQAGDFPQGKQPNGNDIVITNQAIINPSGAILESTTGNNTALQETTVHSHNDLTVSQSGPNSASENSNVTHTITVTNNNDSGSFPVTCGHPNCVQMHDPLPPGLIIENSFTFSPMNAWQCQALQNPVNVVDCQGDLDGSSGTNAVTINVPVFVTATDGAELDNQACVDPSNAIMEYDETNNCSTQVIVVTPPTPPPAFTSMTITKSAAEGLVSAGGTETYTLVVANNAAGSSAEAANPTVTDDVSSLGLTIVGTPTTTNGSTCTVTNSSQLLTCNGSNLASLASATITFQAQLPATASGSITNTATVHDANDSCSCSPTSSVTVSVGAATVDLTIDGNTGAPASVAPPGVVTFTVPAANHGTKGTAATVHISNVLNQAGPGITLVGAGGTNGWLCGPLVSFTIDCTSTSAGMAPGDTTVLTLKFNVLSGATNPLILTSTIDPAGTFQPTNTPNNSKSATITVNPSAACTACKDLEAAIFAPASVKLSGSTATIPYSRVVTNVGDTNIQGTSGNPAVTVWVNVDFFLSVGTAPTVTGPSGLVNPWACDGPFTLPTGEGYLNFTLASPSNGNTIACHGDLLVGQSVTIGFTGTDGSSFSGATYTTQVIADPLGAVEPPDPLDTDTTVTTAK